MQSEPHVGCGSFTTVAFDYNDYDDGGIHNDNDDDENDVNDGDGDNDE